MADFLYAQTAALGHGHLVSTQVLQQEKAEQKPAIQHVYWPAICVTAYIVNVLYTHVELSKQVDRAPLTMTTGDQLLYDLL
jgi:hypothetical protein